MDKKAIREYYKNRRQDLSEQQSHDFSIGIANRLLTLPIWSHSFYHLFLSSIRYREVNTEPILTLLHAKNKEVVVPKIHDEERLDHYLLTDATPLQLNALGIPEPQRGVPLKPAVFDVVFVPLLAYDRRGNRLGYGKGYYDRFLADCRSDCLKIGLSFFKPEKQLPVTPTDIPLDYCVTPEKEYNFRRL